MQRTFRNNPLFPNYGVADAWCPLISIQAPAPCTLGQIAIRILERLGYDVERDLKENTAWLRVRQQLRVHGILFLHIDDTRNHPSHIANKHFGSNDFRSLAAP
jgi:hypothetical protein